ncbi:MAG: hypothetical protein ABR553_03440 [Gammaproteobacteria bacterium]
MAHPVKFLFISVLVLSGIAGCAGTYEQAAEAPAAAPAPSAAVTQALSEAGAAIKTAKNLDWIWRDTEAQFKAAEAAAQAGDEAKAVKLANNAKFEAEAAVNQYYIEKAKPLLAALQTKRGLTAGEKAKADAAAAALSKARGKQAYEILSNS